MFRLYVKSITPNQLRLLLNTGQLPFKQTKHAISVISFSYPKITKTSSVNLVLKKFFFTKKNEEEGENKKLFNFTEYEKQKEKNKKVFLELVKLYDVSYENRRGVVDFIRTSLQNMKDFGVHRDMECYKTLLNLLPKGPYVATNKILGYYFYHPIEQLVVKELLDYMTANGVHPDKELGDLIYQIFGPYSDTYDAYRQLLYWSLKLKNRSPWPLPVNIPDDSLSIAKIAIEKITSVDPQTKISVFQTDILPNCLEKTWIVSGQSEEQKQLLRNHPHESPVVVEGGDRMWVRDKSIDFFVLKRDGEPLPYIYEDLDDIVNMKVKYFNPSYKKKRVSRSVHEQDDGIIYAVCATGTSEKNSLLSWVRILQQRGNDILGKVPVLFRFKTMETTPATFSEELVEVKTEKQS